MNPFRSLSWFALFMAGLALVIPAGAETYTVDFEGAGETNTSYASASVTLNGISWNMTEALIGTDTADWKNGARSARLRGYGASAMTMEADKANGVGSISFSYRRYGTDAQVDWRVEYSANGGTDWTQVGSDFTAPTSDDVQAFSNEVNVGGPVRVRIKRATETGTANRRLNIDDIVMTDGTGEPPAPQTNVKFTATAAAVNEDAGTYQVTVVKTLAEGNVSGEIGLSGTATYGAGADYTIDTTNFTMNGATTSAVFTVTINDDEEQEGAETVILTLANVAGGTIATPSVFTLTINANDAGEPEVWINEILYDPPGTDVAGTEWVEVAGPAGVDLANYRLVRYNGNDGKVYGTDALAGLIDDEGCGYGAVDLVYSVANSLQNGAPDGIALARVEAGVTSLVQFLSYEGTFAGVGGPADGVTSVHIGSLDESANTLQLGGTATNYSGFTWETNTASRGTLNVNQFIAGCIPSSVTNVKFTASAAAVDEDAGTYEVTVIKTLAEGNVSGEIGLSGTATYGAGADYTIDTTNFTMNGATTSAVFSVTINDDEDQEGAETIILTLANVTGGTAVSPSVFTLTVNANDVPPEGIVEFRFNTAPYLQATSKDAGLTVSDMTLTSGTIEQNITGLTNFPDAPYIEETGGWTADNQAAAKAFQFTITPAEGSAVTITSITFRAYATAAGPSAFGYDIGGGLATYAVDAPSAALLLVDQPVVGVENQTDPILVQIQGWTNMSRLTSGGGVFRLDDVVLYGSVTAGSPQTNVRFTASAAAVDEDAGTYEVTVIKTLAEGNVSGEVGLSGTAIYGGGADYTIDTTNFTMNGATTSATFTVTINDDEDEEGPETVILTLANVAGGTLVQPTTFTLTINASDGPPPPESIVEFRFNAEPHLQVTDKNANLTVSDMALTAGTIETNVVTGTYFPDEPYIEETAGWTADNQADAKAFLFTVTPADGSTVTIDGIFFRAYATGAGPSAFGFDIGGGLATYEVNAPDSALLVVSQAVAGVQNQSGAVVVKIQGWLNGSRASAGTGAFRLDDVVLFGSVSGGGGPATNVKFTASAAAVDEDAGTYQVTVIKTLAEGDVSGEIGLSGTATYGAGADYTIDTTNFTMNGATTSATFTVTINDDEDEEGAETVILTLANVVGGTPVAPTTFTLTINASDEPPIPQEGILAFRFNTDPYLPVTTKDAQLTVSDMSLTAGTIEQNVTVGDYFPDEPYIEETGGWAVDNQEGAKAFQFTVTPAEGYAVTVTGVSFRAYATPAGPSAVGFDIGGITTHAENLTNAVLLHVNQGVADVLDRTEPFLVKIQGWTNGTRVSAGTGVFRLDDVVLYGTVISQGAGTPPVLNAIGSKSVALNGTLQFFVAATPTEGDAVSLTASNLPAGAFFYPTNEVGSFFWQNASPTGAYSVTFNAADDDGADAETITITVTPAVGEPEVTRFVLTAGATPSVTLTETQVGVTYALEFTTSLKDPEPIWTEVDSEPGNGGQITLADPNPAAGMRIYRVITR